MAQGIKHENSVFTSEIGEEEWPLKTRGTFREY